MPGCEPFGCRCHQLCRTWGLTMLAPQAPAVEVAVALSSCKTSIRLNSTMSSGFLHRRRAATAASQSRCAALVCEFLPARVLATVGGSPTHGRYELPGGPMNLHVPSGRN